MPAFEGAEINQAPACGGGNDNISMKSHYAILIWPPFSTKIDNFMVQSLNNREQAGNEKREQVL